MSQFNYFRLFRRDVKVDLNYYDLPGLHTLKENRFRPDAAEIGWENLSVSGKAKGSKTIIKNVTGCVPPGTLMAIMGGVEYFAISEKSLSLLEYCDFKQNI